MFIQTGPARWTDAACAARLGLKAHVALPTPTRAAPDKTTRPAAHKAAAPTLAPRVPRPAQVTAAKAAPPSSQPVALPPAPVFVRQARDMGRHELRAAGARAKLWLTAANAASCVRRLTSDERHGVECTEARLIEMRRAAGLDSANW